jgi:hypothetical protein
MVIFHGIQHDFNHDLTPATRDMDGYGVNCETFGNQEPFDGKRWKHSETAKRNKKDM